MGGWVGGWVGYLYLGFSVNECFSDGLALRLTLSGLRFQTGHNLSQSTGVVAAVVLGVSLGGCMGGCMGGWYVHTYGWVGGFYLELGFIGLLDLFEDFQELGEVVAEGG